MPALDAVLREGFGAVSVDTFRPAVAHAALRAGASMINDVYGARQPGMLKVLGEHKPWVCVMHMKGSPQTMQKGAIAYEDVVEQVAAWLDESAGAVVAAGVPQDCVLVDPGIGFGKTDAHNLALTLGCQRLASRTGCAVLYGASRKSIIGRLAAVDAPKKRLPGSLSLLGGAYRSGARVLRVHDVEETVSFWRLSARPTRGERPRRCVSVKAASRSAHQGRGETRHGGKPRAGSVALLEHGVVLLPPVTFQSATTRFLPRLFGRSGR